MKRIAQQVCVVLLFGLTAPAILQATPQQNGSAAPAVTPPVAEVSLPALAAKAPGAPGYGLQIATSRGKVMMTNLTFDPASKRASFNLYRIGGPAGLGPYRAGIAVSFHPAQQMPANHPFPAAWYDNYFNIEAIVKGSPAEKAGLEKDKYGLRDIVNVDGYNFGWDIGALVYYISNHAEVRVETVKIPLLFGGPSYHTYKIKTEKPQPPPDPADGTFQILTPDQMDDTLKAWLHNKQTWVDLLVLRTKQDRFAPLAIDLDGRKLWVVCSAGPPRQDGTASRYVEFWKEDPAKGALDTGIFDVWPAPGDGMKTGRILRAGESWYRLKNYAEDPSTHRLAQFELEPWKADVEPLLGGKSLAEEMGDVRMPGVRESLEEAANDMLIEWKTRTLPGLLAKEPASALEDRVIHLEKGLLALDREVRHIHERADEIARAKAAQQAEAQKPGEPAAAPPAGDAGSAELERLGDVLTQRQAILQAILASMKQALAQARR